MRDRITGADPFQERSALSAGPCQRGAISTRRASLCDRGVNRAAHNPGFSTDEAQDRGTEGSRSRFRYSPVGPPLVVFRTSGFPTCQYGTPFADPADRETLWGGRTWQLRRLHLTDGVPRCPSRKQRGRTRNDLQIITNHSMSSPVRWRRARSRVNLRSPARPRRWLTSHSEGGTGCKIVIIWNLPALDLRATFGQPRRNFAVGKFTFITRPAPTCCAAWALSRLPRMPISALWR
jgi:hypothetical protein